MKTYEQAIVLLAELKQSADFKYVCAGAYALMAQIYEKNIDSIYDDVADELDRQYVETEKNRKKAARIDCEMRRLSNIAKSY